METHQTDNASGDASGEEYAAALQRFAVDHAPLDATIPVDLSRDELAALAFLRAQIRGSVMGAQEAARLTARRRRYGRG